MKILSVIGLSFLPIFVSAQISAIKDSIAASVVESMIDEYKLADNPNSCITIRLTKFNSDMKDVMQPDSTYRMVENPTYTLLLFAYRGTSGIRFDRISDFIVIRGVPVVFESDVYYFIAGDSRRDKIKKQLTSQLKFFQNQFFVMWKLEVENGSARITKETWPKK